MADWNSRIQAKVNIESAMGQIYIQSGLDLITIREEELHEQRYTIYIQEIDPNLKGPDGRPNLNRMQDGKAPYIYKDGKVIKIELHHHEQKDLILVEIDEISHRERYHEALHHNLGFGQGRAYDPSWDLRRIEHWMIRAGEFLEQEKMAA